MGMVMDLAGAGISAFGQVEAGQAEAEAAKYNSQVAANNAAYASKAGSAQSEVESLKNAQAESGVKAKQSANNIDVNSGSALKVQQGATEAGQIDIQNVENNALLKAYGYQQESELQKQEQKQATLGADIGAAGGLLSDISAIDQKWESAVASAGGG